MCVPIPRGVPSGPYGFNQAATTNSPTKPDRDGHHGHADAARQDRQDHRRPSVRRRLCPGSGNHNDPPRPCKAKFGRQPSGHSPLNTSTAGPGHVNMIVGLGPFQLQVAAGQMGSNSPAGPAGQHAGDADGAAPVPQASVMPLPRSQVRIVTSFGECDLDEMDVDAAGKDGAFSSTGPTISSGTLATSRQKKTTCGLPMRDAGMRGSMPRASNDEPRSPPSGQSGSGASTIAVAGQRGRNLGRASGSARPCRRGPVRPCRP